MKRRQSPERTLLASVVRTTLVVSLALVVLWHLGHSFAPKQEAGPQPSGTPAYITTSDVNLRSGPGTTHEVLTVLPVKTDIAVTGTSKHGFLPVAIAGQRAWVSAEFVAPEGSVPEREIQPEPTMVPAGIPAPAPTEAPMPTDAPPPDVQVADVVVGSESVDTGSVEVADTEPEPEPESEPEPEYFPDPHAYTEVAELEVEGSTPDERWIEIDRTLATVTLHDGDRIVAVYDGLMGKDPSRDGYYATAVGTYQVFSMERELTETPFAPDVFLTHWVGFDPERSNGIHSPVRDAQGNVVQTGGTVTLGCVRLGADEAAAMYDFAFIGMRVEVQD